MKRSLIAASVLSAVFMSAGVFAADEDMGELKINGEVVGTSCTFEGANSATIELSQVGVDRLTDLNPGDIYTGYTSPEAILKVKCTNTANPRISLTVLNLWIICKSPKIMLLIMVRASLFILMVLR